MTDAKHNPDIWLFNAREGKYRAGSAVNVSDTADFAVEGLVPATGVSMWFGPGSTGKTQMLLWMAAHIAAPANRGPRDWLGARIQKRGHVLFLSAEDTREHIFIRIGGMAKAMKVQFPEIDEHGLCDRIHVIPFLSLDEAEFAAKSPSLFQGHRNDWKPSPTLLGVEQLIDTWNADHDPDDQIVAVIMDSAVSMSGFDLTDSEATTEFLFRINRVSNRQGVFWAIVGHTPKGAGIKNDPLEGAADRLRGSAMWSTTPRTVVELRIASDTENLTDIYRAFPTLGKRDIVVANVVKSNSKGADFKPRVLRRLSEGAFEDLTADYPDICRSWSPIAPEPLKSFDCRKAAVCEMIRTVTDGASEGATFKRDQLEAEFQRNSSQYPALADVIGLSSRKHEKNEDSLAYILRLLKDDGHIYVQRNGPIKVLALHDTANSAEQ
jgi:hypothetical protein